MESCPSFSSISASGARKKKEYVITDQGRAAFAVELRRLRELVSNGGKMEDET